MNNQKNKPETDGWLEHYVIDKLCCLGELLVDLYRLIARKWYCSYCHKWHSPRVHKWHLQAWQVGLGYSIDVCSLGRDAHIDSGWPAAEHYNKDKDQAI